MSKLGGQLKMIKRITIPIFTFFLCGYMCVLHGQEVRSIDGHNNNPEHPEWGSEGSELYLISKPAFSDGISSMTGRDRMNPRMISNALFSQGEQIFDEQNLSDFVWVFGQFIDHEIVLVENDLREPLFIDIPLDDEVFSPDGSPMVMFRSRSMLGTGTDTLNFRKYANGITAFIDGSAVYGSSEARAAWLRTFTDGKLKVSQGNLLPWNTITGEFNDHRDPDAPFMDDPVRNGTKHFVAGDIRANENPLLIAFHTLLVREHNRLCDEIKQQNSGLSDEEIYQRARKYVGALIQSVTYNEWLPEMGVHLPEYNGYRQEVNAQISNVFSAAAFRMGHTLINSNILRLQSSGDEIPNGHITLKDAFFNPTVISLAGGIEPYFRGMATQVQQKLDCKVIDDVRNFLFGAPSAGGLDLAAININRGRERGLADFNSIRSDIGLPRLQSFDELTNDAEALQALQDIYENIDQVDPWVGMLAENFMPGAMFGSTIKTILEDQFKRLRDGDRFFFKADPYFTSEEIDKIDNTSLRDIIMRNTDIEIMQENIFEALDRIEFNDGPEIDQVDLTAVAYPNPTPGNVNIKIHSTSDEEIQYEIYNDLGALVDQGSYLLIEGDNVIPLELTSSYSSQFFNVIIRKALNFAVVRIFRS